MSFYEDPLVTLLHGDCIEVMATLPADSVDAVVTDPPYGLEFMGKEWDAFRPEHGNWNDGKWAGKGMTDKSATSGGIQATDGLPSLTYANNLKCRRCGKWQRGARPCQCESPDWEPRPNYRNQAFQAWCEQWGREALRVTKPGGYLLAFGGTRTHHRLVCALEDAGWIIRDELTWIYASGFPKGKANLKPAHEPIVLARKPGPLRPLAIDECRIGTAEDVPSVQATRVTDYPQSYQGDGPGWGRSRGGHAGDEVDWKPTAGRWPSNVLLSDPELFDEPNPYVVGSGATDAGGGYGVRGDGPLDGRTSFALPGQGQVVGYGDSGGYSRFFIVPKADRAERERGLVGADGTRIYGGGKGNNTRRCRQCGSRTFSPQVWPACGHEDYEWVDKLPIARANVHPTVKPIDLMRHLVRLVTPSGGVVLDPFLGSGTTCLAASEEGLRSIGIEREAEYLEIAKGRLIATPMGLGLVAG